MNRIDTLFVIFVQYPGCFDQCDDLSKNDRHKVERARSVGMNYRMTMFNYFPEDV